MEWRLRITKSKPMMLKATVRETEDVSQLLGLESLAT
jgi:hypothetical protein